MNLSWAEAALLGTAFLATVGGTRAYQSYAVARGILANPNFRSLHERPMPRGGGIVFSAVFLVGVVVLWTMGVIDAVTTRVMVLGGAVATVSGFVDDCRPLGVRVKLAIQCVLAAWVLVAFGGRPLADLPWTPVFADRALTWLALVWLMNAYNFMDGIDGMASSGGVFLAGGAALTLWLAGADPGVVLLAALLGICSAGFLWFNWPPARLFMGDAGSLFLGYCFGALMVRTVTSGGMHLWTWVILLGYFGGDTTTTTTLRIFVTKCWYAEHRSHAYQNLARIWNSHLRVVSGVSVYHLCWLLPLAVWSVTAPTLAPLAAGLAVAPVVIWTIRHGPLRSSA